MNVLFIGGEMDGQIVGLVPVREDIRVRITPELVEFYRLETDVETIARHRRQVAHYYRSGESAESLVDLHV